MNHLVWFRTDLRVGDNPALSHACQLAADNSGSQVIGLYFITEQQWQNHDLGPRKIQLIKNAVSELKNQLSHLNIPLIVLSADTFNNSIDVLHTVLSELDIRHLHFNLEYEVNERKRDIKVKKLAKELGVQVSQFHDQCLIPPGEVKTQTGEDYKVFTPFKRQWCKLLQLHLTQPMPKPDKLQQDIKLFSKYENTENLYKADELWQATEDAALDAFDDFYANHLTDYHEQRDRPDLHATSKLSMYLSLGIISPNQCFYPVFFSNEGQVLEGQSGCVSWMNELIWREFYRHLLVAFPELCKHKNFKSEAGPKKWNDRDQDFESWCNAETGYPIVDAAILQLKATGWMHNRLRMIVAMFLTKHLLIDWRKGEAFFNYYLVDADLASNNGGWQWSASTGADSVPYFRIFNPITQSTKFDPEAEFIMHYLPQLSDLSLKQCHFPDEKIRDHIGYPEAVVDHKWARERALEEYDRRA